MNLPPLPPLSDPCRYVGLFVYDFGRHLSVGYTAAEILILRASDEHRAGRVFQIYRADEGGSIELRGVADAELTGQEAICFLRADGRQARDDFDALRLAAQRTPIPRSADLVLGRFYAFTPAQVTALQFPQAVSAMIYAWLAATKLRLGDTVESGAAAFQRLTGSDGLRIATTTLAPLLDDRDRPAADVLATIREPIQR